MISIENWTLEDNAVSNLGSLGRLLLSSTGRCQETQNLVLVFVIHLPSDSGEPVSFRTSNFPTINRRIPASFFDGEKQMKRMSIFKHFERKIL